MEHRWAEAIREVVDDRSTAHLRFRVHGESMLPTLRPDDEVIVEPVRWQALRPGDLVLLQSDAMGNCRILHRFLGTRRREGRRFLLTAGDHRRRLDPLHPEEALKGRAIAAFRGNQPLSLPVGRRQVWRHRARTTFWTAGRRLRGMLPFLLILSLLAVDALPARAAVTLVSFKAEWKSDEVRISWATASEVDAMGFYLWRSEQEGGTYERITDLIAAEGDVAGASYESTDGDVAATMTYFYKLEDLSSSGSSHFWGPVGTAAGQPTSTSTATPTVTATLAPATYTATSAPATFTATASSTPTATDAPSSTPSSTSSSTPTRTLTASPTASLSPSPRPSATATARRSPTPGRTATRPAAVTRQVTAQPAPSSTPLAVTPAATPVLLATATPVLPLPSPPVTAVSAAVVSTPLLAVPTPTQAIARQPDDQPPEDHVPTTPEVQTRAQTLRTWVLIGVAGVVLSGLLLLVLALVALALYRWGYLRRG